MDCFPVCVIVILLLLFEMLFKETLVKSLQSQPTVSVGIAGRKQVAMGWLEIGMCPIS